MKLEPKRSPDHSAAAKGLRAVRSGAAGACERALRSAAEAVAEIGPPSETP